MLPGIILSVFAALSTVTIAASARREDGPAPLPPIKHPIAVVAHRAGKALAPENTLAAIRNAIQLGVDYVELDIRTTKDGKLVIMHDRSVDRTTNGTGNVRDLTLDEIRKLDAGSKYSPKFMGEKVPTFDEVLDLCHNKVYIYVDHKEAPTQQVYDAIRQHGMEKQVVVYNDPMDLKEWKRIAPHIPVMPSLPDQFRRPGGVAEFYKLLPAEVLDGHMLEWTKELVDQAHAVGAKVYVDIMGPTDNADGYRKALETGVDGLQTDKPDQLLQFLAQSAPPAKR
jgi:glycerophosphoryl diester phosphodiesterase